MKICIKLLSTVLVLAFLLSAFASCEILEQLGIKLPTDPTEENPPIAEPTGGCEHFWIIGVCRLCNAVCSHEWGDGICKKCDTACKHTQDNEHSGDTCQVCGEKYRRASYTVTFIAEGNSKPVKQVMDIAMSVDELCAHFMPTWIYIFRHEIMDVQVNGNTVSDFSSVINSDIEIKLTVKDDALRITVIAGIPSETWVMYLPKAGVTIQLIADLIYPGIGSFDRLIADYHVKVDGVAVTDPSHKIDKSCTVHIVPKSEEGGESNPEKKEISVTVENLSSGERYEGKFDQGTTLSSAVSELTGTEFNDLLAQGIIFLNGQKVEKDVELDSDAKVQITVMTEGDVLITFEGAPDLGRGERVRASSVVPIGCTFEEALDTLLDMTWEEYENSFYNTRISGKGDYTTWIPVHRDTVILESCQIDAIRYYEHERTENVTLILSITGIIDAKVTVPYDTPLSKAFEQFQPPLDFDTCMEEWDMFINVYSLMGDAKLKYDSFIYGTTLCDGHVWNGRTCTKCGSTCVYTYYEGLCPECGTEHPTEQPSSEYVKVTVQVFDASGKMIDEVIKEVPYGSDIKEFTLIIWGELDEVLRNGTLTVNGEEVVLGQRIELFGGEKIVYRLNESKA